MTSSAPQETAANGRASSTNLPQRRAGDVQAAKNEAIAEIIDSMEQGVLVWSEDGICKMYNQRIFDVLELTERDLYPGMGRSEFLRRAVMRGEFDADTAQKAEHRFAQLVPFSFDRAMPSGAIIATTARPVRSGGFVVTFTDVTETRHKEIELEAQREKFREAEIMARDALAMERERKREARDLSQLDEWLQSCKSLEELLKIVSKFLSRLFEGSAGELYIYSNSRDVLDGACSWRMEAPRAHIQPDECWGLRRGRLYKYQHREVNFTCSHVDGPETEDFGGQYLCIPMIAHGDTVGLLHLRFTHPSQRDGDGSLAPIPDHLVEYAIRCSERISLAIANVRLRDELRDQSTKDPLTGLFNRRYFLECCRREISQASRSTRPLGLISLDADHFKNFNDTHGHDAGDLVLRSISESMMELFQKDAVVARFGGEEFSILVPDMPTDACLQKADILRKKIETIVLRYHGRLLPKVTVSIGVACYPENGATPQELLREADRALYMAKDAGRNRCVIADTSPGSRG